MRFHVVVPSTSTVQSVIAEDPMSAARGVSALYKLADGVQVQVHGEKQTWRFSVNRKKHAGLDVVSHTRRVKA